MSMQAIIMTESYLTRLLQLCSQALPVGTYAYSQGLESAIAAGFVSDAASASKWIRGVLQSGIATLDLPALYLAYDAWSKRDEKTIRRIDEYLQASRETSELLLEDIEMGRALQRLLKSLTLDSPDDPSPSFVTRFAIAGVSWNIPLIPLAEGFCFSWVENQLAVAIKSVPLGQSEAQRELGALIPDIGSAVTEGITLGQQTPTNNWSFGISMPGLALLSSAHETLEGRLYRS